MARHIMNTGVIVSWIGWLERLVLIGACVFFAQKAYRNQPKLTSTLLLPQANGTINVTCDPANDAAVIEMKQVTKELARALFLWDLGAIEGYKFQYQTFKRYLKPGSEAASESYGHVLSRIGTGNSKGDVEQSSSRFQIVFDEKGWTSRRFEGERRWAVSTTITQTVSMPGSTPDDIKWNLFMTLVEGDSDAFYHIDSYKLTRI